MANDPLEGSAHIPAKLLTLTTEPEKFKSSHLEAVLDHARSMFNERYPGEKPVEIFGEWALVAEVPEHIRNGHVVSVAPAHWSIPFQLRRQDGQ